MIYYQASIEALLQKLKTSPTGLSQQEVKRRLEKFGFNELVTKIKINKFKLFITQFKSFIIYILLFAVTLSLIASEYLDALIILTILVANALMGYFQELSAHKSLEALKKFNYLKAKVWRNQKLKSINAKYLVIGDVISLESGDKVPADCRLLESSRLKVQESTLTGESIAVNKAPGMFNLKTQIGDQSNMLFSSTTIAEGMATAVVVGTGMQTEIGKITCLIRETKEELTPLQKKLNVFGKKLSFAIICISLLIFCIIGTKEYLLVGFSFTAFREIALISVALAVAAVPEGLPAVVTISLSIGVKKLLKKKTLVKRLASVETLGSCDVICTDKTGTLTRNEMMVSHVWNLDGEALITGVGYEPIGDISKQLSPLVYEIGMVCNSASVIEEKDEWQIAGDPTEAALLVSAMKAGVKPEVDKISTIPFDTTRKKMSVLIKKQTHHYVYTKGAPDQTLEDCSHVSVNGEVVKLTDALKATIHKQINHFAKQALRVIAFAYKPTTADAEVSEEKLIFVGLQAMIDPPRDDVINSIKTTKQAGIRVVMITGDYKETAIAIGKKIGIEGLSLEGKELQKMNEIELQKALSDGVNIFSRTIPADKQKIVEALQKQGSIVAMTGDGINDAPALKKADIGVAVGSGTDVAKEASDFILLDNSFTHIVNAIEEGRGIFNNIQKTIMLLLSGNLSEVLIVFFAVIFGWDLPLTVIMILWINLISDGAPALALAVDTYDKEIMKKKPDTANTSILTAPQMRFVVFLGLVATVFTLLLFKIYSQYSLIEAQTVVFNAVFIAEVGILFAIRSLFRTPQSTNIWLWLTVTVTCLMQLIIMYSPAAQIFNVVALNFGTLLQIVSLGLLVFLGGQLYIIISTRKAVSLP